MNSIGIVHAGREDYYEELGKEDYYTGEIDPKGKFYGKGAARLGIEKKQIEQHDPRLKHLFHGHSPDGSTALRKGAYQCREYKIWTYKNPETQKVQTFRSQKHIPAELKDKVTEATQKYRSVVAYDNVMSAPKDVSVLWSQAPNTAIREKIHRIHIAAVTEAIGYLDQHACYTRTGRNGSIYEKAEGVFAVFHHTTSRELDPQLHSHVLLLNTGFTAKGKAGALDGRKILEHRYAAGMVYQNALRQRLEQELGVKTFDRPFEKGKGVSFGIEGVSAEVTRSFSRRSLQIEERITPTMSGAEIRAEVLKTRKAKNMNVDSAALIAEWQQRGREQGFQWAKVVNRQWHQEKIDIPILHRTIATSLQCKEHHRPLKESQLFSTILGASRGRLSTAQAQELVETYKTQYLRPLTVNTLVKKKTTPEKSTNYKVNTQETCYTLNQEGKKLVDYKSRREKLWSGAKTVIAWHKEQRHKVRKAEAERKRQRYYKQQKQFTRKMTFLYATGKITRRQYLQFTQGKGLPQSEFGIKVYQAFGLISKKQAEYIRTTQRYKLKQQQTLHAWKVRTKNLTIKKIDPMMMTSTTAQQIKSQQAQKKGHNPLGQHASLESKLPKMPPPSRSYQRQRERER
jgi:conjugative relaxase-like TrwC/TraI family protein